MSQPRVPPKGLIPPCWSPINPPHVPAPCPDVSYVPAVPVSRPWRPRHPSRVPVSCPWRPCHPCLMSLTSLTSLTSPTSLTSLTSLAHTSLTSLTSPTSLTLTSLTSLTSSTSLTLTSLTSLTSPTSPTSTSPTSPTPGELIVLILGWWTSRTTRYLGVSWGHQGFGRYPILPIWFWYVLICCAF